MLVAHSQGNLFMNHAYDHILPTVTKDRVAAAHIAPASPTLRGDYILADIDLVINAIRIQGVTSVPDNNLGSPCVQSDVSGHTLIGTYLDGTRDGRGKIKAMIEVAMGKLGCFVQRSFFQGCAISYDDNYNFVSYVHIYESPSDSFNMDGMLYVAFLYRKWIYLVDSDAKIIKNISKVPDDNDEFFGGSVIAPTINQIVNFQGY